jgi:O-antigen ligase
MAIHLSQFGTSVQDQTKVRPTAPLQSPPRPAGRHRLTSAYVGSLLFVIVYFFRPNDWLPLGTFPIAKTVALIPILALLFAVASGYKLRFSREVWILLLLFLQLAICVPFSTWRGGSFQTVFFDFSKVTLLAVVLVQVLNAASRIRRVVFVQTAAVAVVAAISIYQGTRLAGRMTGALGGLFGNPNDLAIGIAMTVPYAIMFLLLTRNPAKRLFWLVVISLMVAGIMATYSRTGFLSLMGVMLAVGWFFGVQGKNKKLLVAIVLVLVLGPLAFTAKYLVRVESIFDSSLDQTGSADARHELLISSLKMAATHPLFGIGPGQFVVQSGNWHVAHNSFTEMAAEAGIPGGVLFVWLFACAFNRLRKAVPDPLRHGKELQLLRAATLSSVFSFVVSACFASLEYEFFPYFFVAYCVALTALLENHDRGRPRTVFSPVTHEVAACAE